MKKRAMHSFEINADSVVADDDVRSRHMDRGLYETQQSWLLGLQVKKKKKYVDFGCIVCSYKALQWTIIAILIAFLVIGLPVILSKEDDYSKALRSALLFFNAEKSGPLPKDNNVSWRGDIGSPFRCEARTPRRI